MTAHILQKTQEICFALMRIAAYMRRFELRKKIEQLSIHLMENIYYGNTEMAESTIQTILGFIEFSKNLYEVEPLNAKIISEELEKVEKEIKRQSGKGEVALNLKTLFPISEEEKKPAKSANPEKMKNEFPLPDSNYRKKAIISMISKTDAKKVQLKEISREFPEVTDRTIRNDIRELIQEGRMIKEGGGPASMYALAEQSSQSPTSLPGDLPSVINL